MLETRCKYYENEAMFHGFIPHIMGTRFDILLIHSDIDRLNTLWADIAYELERLDKILNRFDPHSEVSKINNHASQSKIQISKEMKSILQLCSYYYETTSHLFDITLKDFSQIQLHEHSYISFTSPDISLDFGGFAKGYALKKIRKFIEQENISDAFANFGMLGVIAIPFAVVAILRILEACSTGVSNVIVDSCALIIAYRMVNSFLPTILLTHGVLLLLVFMYFIPRGFIKDEKTKAARSEKRKFAYEYTRSY